MQKERGKKFLYIIWKSEKKTRKSCISFSFSRGTKKTSEIFGGFKYPFEGNFN